jgi:hypothetical protein
MKRINKGERNAQKERDATGSVDELTGYRSFSLALFAILPVRKRACPRDSFGKKKTSFNNTVVACYLVASLKRSEETITKIWSESESKHKTKALKAHCCFPFSLKVTEKRFT